MSDSEVTPTPEPTPEPDARTAKLESYASAHRMLLYLLMGLVVLDLADIPSWATMPVFILYLWSDHGPTILALQDQGWSGVKITARLLVDVLPLIAVCLVAWIALPEPVPTGLAALVALAFYLISRHRLQRWSAQAQEA